MSVAARLTELHDASDCVGPAADDAEALLLNARPEIAAVIAAAEVATNGRTPHGGCVCWECELGRALAALAARLDGTA